MPVSRRKKDITPNTPISTQERTAAPLPDPYAFQQYLRELARGAIRVVLEDVMREELNTLIGVSWGESSPKRKGYRNGFYRRDLVTSSGRIEELQVPRDRVGQFHTQVFERYRRYEPQVAEGLTQMFVAGVSTRHPWERSLKPSWEWLPVPARSVASTGMLSQQFEDWRQRALQEHWRVLYLDGVHFSIRHGEKADATIILTALAVDLDGNKEVLARLSLCGGKQGGMAWALAGPAQTWGNPN